MKNNHAKCYGILPLFFFFLLFFPGNMFGEERTATRELAKKLSLEQKNHEAASIEFRRLAMTEEDSTLKGRYYFFAAYEYLLLNEDDLTEKMLEYCGKFGVPAKDIYLLKAVSAVNSRRNDQAEAYFNYLLNENTDQDTARFCANHMAALMFEKKEWDRTFAYLETPHPSNEDGKNALFDYRKKKKKSPFLGGMLGLVPGLGYAYSGDYMTAIRSFVINGLFIYGAVDTAEHENWGAFSVITFFELTWYSGSIYGGVDAAHRYNRQLRNEVMAEITGRQRLSLNMEKLPSISFTFEF